MLWQEEYRQKERKPLKFKEFEIKKDILNAVRKAGYEEATPIQEKAIPVILEGHDVIGLAQTGTGKTAAFALPILNNIEFRKKKRIRALILAPTRELAIQTFENFKKFVEDNKDKILTTESYNGYDKLFCFVEDETEVKWVFHEYDLEKVEESE